MSEFEQSVAELPCVTVEAVMRLRERAILLEQQLTAANERAEKLQARIDESQKQEPYCYTSTYDVKSDRIQVPCSMEQDAHIFTKPLYAHPSIPPDVEELQEEVFDLTAALAVTTGNFNTAQRENAELRKQLEESKVPEGWQLVPKEPTERMQESLAALMDYPAIVRGYRNMLSIAPKPKEKP